MKRLHHICLIAAFLLAAAPAWAAGGAFNSATSLTEPVPAAGDEFGAGQSNGTALSTNGRYALIGANFAMVGNVPDAGKAYIYHRVHGAWTLMQEIDDPDNAANDNFGYEFAFSADGRVALIGSGAAVDGQAHAGKAYLYTLHNGVWTETNEFDDPAVTAGDWFGYSGVVLSADGNTALIGAWGTTINGNANAGEAYVFKQSSGTWIQTAAIADPDNTAGDFFGYPLALSADGSTAALIGSQAAVNGQSKAGKAYLYALSNGSWTRTHEFDDPAAGANDFFGDSGVSLSADGDTALIGAVGTTLNGIEFAGEAYVFSATTNGTWTQTAAIPDPDNAVDAFGYPVTLAADGRAALIGSDAAVNGQAGAGKAYLFTLRHCAWNKTREFDDPKAAAGDNFGDSGVALSGDVNVRYTAFISAYGTTVNGLANAGEAYLYEFSRWPMQRPH